MCGMCARHKAVPKQVSDQSSIDIFKDNKITGAQCYMSETIDPSHSEETCTKINKHKVSINGGQLLEIMSSDIMDYMVF